MEVFTLPRKAFQPSSVKCINFDLKSFTIYIWEVKLMEIKHKERKEKVGDGQDKS